MKSSRAQTRRKVHKIPSVRFETGSAMTRFAGLVVFLPLFRELRIRERLRACFRHIEDRASYQRSTLVLLLIVQLLLGFRRLRSVANLRDDPMVLRVVGLSMLPDVSTVSRMLAEVDSRTIGEFRRLSRDLVLDRLHVESPRVVTLDFDGSVMSTSRHAEGVAVGFNRKKKGARSYYPLFCTVAQTGQFLDVHHRPGNVHDSNGAKEFMTSCIQKMKKRLPKAIIEARVDSAFFDEAVLDSLSTAGVTFTASVPFERFTKLKAIVETMERWERINGTWSFAEVEWKPKSWTRSHDRFLLLRKRAQVQTAGPLQLDLFVPRDHAYEYKVIVTNRTGAARTVLHFHNGRGGQEKVFAEGKQHAGLDLIPVRTKAGNQFHLLAAMVAHNLARELQMRAAPPSRSTEPRRPARWQFNSLGTLRETLLHRPGRLLRPQGRLTLLVAGTKDDEAMLHRLMARQARQARHAA